MLRAVVFFVFPRPTARSRKKLFLEKTLFLSRGKILPWSRVTHFSDAAIFPRTVATEHPICGKKIHVSMMLTASGLLRGIINAGIYMCTALIELIMHINEEFSHSAEWK